MLKNTQKMPKNDQKWPKSTCVGFFVGIDIFIHISDGF